MAFATTLRDFEQNPQAVMQSLMGSASSSSQSTAAPVVNPVDEIPFHTLKPMSDVRPQRSIIAKEGSTGRVVVGSISRVNQQFTPRFVVLQFRPRVQPLHISVPEEPIRFMIRVSLPPPYHDLHSDLYTVYDSKHSVAEGCRVLIPRRIPQNVPMMVELYLWRKNEYHQLCQYEAGQADFTISQLFAAATEKTSTQTDVDKMDQKTNYFQTPTTINEKNNKKQTGNHGVGVMSETVFSLAAVGGSGFGSLFELTGIRAPPLIVGGCSTYVVNVNGEPQYLMTLEDIQLVSKDQSFILLPPSPEFMKSLTFPKVTNTTGGLQATSVVSRRYRRLHITYGHGKQMPVWIWCMLEDSVQLLEPVPDRFLEHAVDHVTKWCGFKDVVEWQQQYDKKEEGFEVLAQVIAWLEWQSPYLYDKTLDPITNKMRIYDEFSMLRRKPCVPTWSGDCEDFSKGMQQLFRAILRRNVYRGEKQKLSEHLKTLVQLANGYCCFIVDASIRNGRNPVTKNPLEDDPNNVALHMYVVLIPWSKVAILLENGGFGDLVPKLQKDDEIKRTVKWPALSLESTEISVANWRLHNPDLDHISLRLKSIARTVKGSGNAWEKVKIHTSGDYFTAEGFYRMDIAAYSRELFDLIGVHTVLWTRRDNPNSNEWTYGVKKTDCMKELNSKSCKNLGFCVIGTATTDKEKSIVEDVQKLYPAVTPLSFTDPFLFSTNITYFMSPKVIRVFSREFEWTPQLHQWFVQSIEADGHYRLLGTEKDGTRKQIVGLMDHMRIVMYQLLPVSTPPNK